MAKVYPLHDAVLKIAHDAANRLVLRPVLDVADGDAAVSKKLLEIVTEIQEQGGQTIPDGAVPQALTIGLKCGFVYFVTPENFMIDTNQKGLII